MERRRHEQLLLCPHLWKDEFGGTGLRGPRCAVTPFGAARRHGHYCDGRAEAEAADAATDHQLVPCVPPVSLPLRATTETAESRFALGSGRLTLRQARVPPAHNAPLRAPALVYSRRTLCPF